MEACMRHWPIRVCLGAMYLYVYICTLTAVDQFDNANKSEYGLMS